MIGWVYGSKNVLDYAKALMLIRFDVSFDSDMSGNMTESYILPFISLNLATMVMPHFRGIDGVLCVKYP